MYLWVARLSQLARLVNWLIGHETWLYNLLVNLILILIYYVLLLFQVRSTPLRKKFSSKHPSWARSRYLSVGNLHVLWLKSFITELILVTSCQWPGNKWVSSLSYCWFFSHFFFFNIPSTACLSTFFHLLYFFLSGLVNRVRERLIYVKPF